MTANEIVKAIKRLKPTAEFSITENDYSTIKWDVLEGKAPTESEINAEISKLQAEEATENANRVTAKKALLDRLGITDDEAKLLLS